MKCVVGFDKLRRNGKGRGRDKGAMLPPSPFALSLSKSPS